MRRGVTLDGAVVVITGASSGIGRGAARAFADKGSKVVLMGRSKDSLRRAEKECRKRGASTLAIKTDVAHADEVEAAARKIVKKFGRIDVWVNNAAVMAYGELGTVPGDVEQRIIEVNLIGQMNGVRAALPHMVDQESGVIINVASLYSRMTSPFVAAYATSKFGVLGMSRILRQELKQKKGVESCTILPGSVDTPIFSNAANYTGKEAKPPPPVSSPDRVVRSIVRNARHPRRHVVIGRIHQLGAVAHATVPWMYDRLVPLAMRSLAISDKAATDSPGNVFDPKPDSSAVKGGWRSETGRRLGWSAAAVAAVGAAAVGARAEVRRRCAKDTRKTRSFRPHMRRVSPSG